MNRKFISLVISFAIIIITITPMVSAEKEVNVHLSNQGITNEQLAEMVGNGEIPQNVIRLSLNDNFISDLTPLGKLTKLRHLSLIGCQISDIAPLSNLINLEVLHLGSNQIESLIPLQNLINLRTLVLIDNQINDITPLMNLTNLNSLGLDWNLISDVWLCTTRVELSVIKPEFNNIYNQTNYNIVHKFRL